MTIRNFREHNIVLNEIALWLEMSVFSEEVFGEIESVILAVESYMYVLLAAKKGC